jgi:hypothetical protein
METAMDATTGEMDMSIYTKESTGETFSTRAIGARADQLFRDHMTAKINAKHNPNGQAVSTINLKWSDAGTWVCTDESGRVLGRCTVSATLVKYTHRAADEAARIDTMMDGGIDSMGMLNK